MEAPGSDRILDARPMIVCSARSNPSPRSSSTDRESFRGRDSDNVQSGYGRAVRGGARSCVAAELAGERDGGAPSVVAVSFGVH
ncbi:hypothetical protein CUJ84_Chr002336 [Rhizobium leguminosarum]|uniref:Uncharacterized protein n=1 Tax=Rhizobium leguminosarum TaxID=384 RepID=A0A2K9Z368_RHILE|nr:hypothetical protein CUJ84_Chr002336 [Rhizobium leguminosarum]